MKVASGLACGRHQGPELAAQAVRSALDAAGLERAGTVFLFLTRDFIRQPQPAILAAARAAGSLQIFGSTASGIFTERDSLLDQSGAAALVLPGDTTARPMPGTPTLSFSGHGTLPFDWHGGAPRAGLLDAEAAAWAHGRLSSDARAEILTPGYRIALARSTGLRKLSEHLPVEVSNAYELRQVAGQSAVGSLRRSLPAELREHPPLHQIALLRQSDEPGIAILSANADGSLTLAEALSPGERICWALRQPMSAEQEMRQSLAAASVNREKPDFALMFSCIGRGPLFYGSDDRDLLAFREQFPGTPLLGAYGNGQIIPAAGKNQLFHNSVITLLFEGAHV